MPGPYPLATLGVTVSSTGISAPTYSDILASLQASFQNIYGSDAYLDPDSQDGQWLGVLADAYNDINNACIAVYNAFSPATAVGAGLSSVVKINGIRRQSSSNSTAPCSCVGQAFTAINNGVVTDANGNRWTLPPTFQIPGGGSITVTATCTVPGAVAAPSQTVQITTPTRGWQSASFTEAATPGAPVETDPTLRQRQSVSTSLPAQTPLENIVAAVANLPGVQAVQPYENDTSVTNGLGIPSHSIALVVAGGDAVAIATAIAQQKNPGTGTYGTTSETIIDQNGVPNVIRFSVPDQMRVIAAITVTPLTGFVSTTELAIQTAMANWVANDVPIGGSVNLNDLVAAAKLPGALGETYKIEYGALTIAFYGNALGTADLPLTYDQEAGLAIGDIDLTVA